MPEFTRRALLAVALVSYGCKPTDKGREPHDAINAAQEFIKARLISPGTANFGGEADTQVDATTRVPFTCVVSAGSNGQWSLEEMDFQ